MADKYIGNQLVRQFKTAKNVTRWGILHVPDDFYTSDKKYPIIIFQHGAGEGGTTEADLPKLLGWGPPSFIANGDKMQFINPGTGKLEKFIVLSIQGAGDAFTNPQMTLYAMDNDDLIKDRINPDGVFCTGLSLGAKSSVFPVIDQRPESDSCLPRITAIAAMSPYLFSSEYNYTYEKALAKKQPLWLLWGSAEETKFIKGCEIISNAFKDNPNLKTTIFPGRGHGGWNVEYNPNWKQDGLSVYEWFLSKMSVSEPVIVPEPAPLHADAGANQTIMLPADSVKLSGTGSYGPEGLKHVWMQASGPVRGVMNNPNSIVVTITGLAIAGEYAFDLVLTAPDGQTAISRVIVAVLPDPNAEPGVTVKVVASRNGVLTVEGPALTESTILKLGLIDLEYKVVN